MSYTFSVFAQKRDIPASVKTAFYDRYPDAELIGWKDKASFFQADFIINDKAFYANFSSSGVWIETGNEIKKEMLPLAVQEGFDKSKYNEWEIGNVEQVVNTKNEILFKLRVRKDALRQKLVYFDLDGKLTKDTLYTLQENQ